MRNSGVAWVQYAYNYCYVRKQPWLGWPAITEDGYYGSATAAAVRRIQRNENYAGNISVDGVYGPQTQRNMDWPHYYRGFTGDVTCFDNTY
ncbi:peptidoglycan-binding domain-containing protein [Jiangella muralis]|uniref:peptidoglycan-binding domain-containing protein n=1 Tax=Jiangella muralis TaxID=702383 RepID=UPI00069F1794|nr:peptidoglycan-binding domain-containing protein [Jiangella muralis]